LGAGSAIGPLDNGKVAGLGTFFRSTVSYLQLLSTREGPMNGLIYLVGLIVVVLFILSFLGLR
jgi:hypothetical protein